MEANGKHARSSNFSAGKLLKVVEIMAFNRQPMRLQDIAAEAGMPQSTASRFLASLVETGYALQNQETLKYSLSLKFCRIGNAIYSQHSLRDICKPYLLELAERCGESACIAVEENMQAIYLDAADSSDNLLYVMHKIGRTAPMHCTGVGKVLLLSYTPEVLREFVKLRGLQIMTPHTISTVEQLEQALQQIRDDGFCLNDEECELGARCVAAPIYDFENKVVAAIGVSGPTHRLNYQKITSVKEDVMHAARRISEEMGYIPEHA